MYMVYNIDRGVPVSKEKTHSRKGVRHKQGILEARASPEPQKWPTTRELAFLKEKKKKNYTIIYHSRSFGYL
jgi:hypothetical protein